MDNQENEWAETTDEKTKVRSTQTGKDDRSSLIKALRPYKITKRMMSGDKKKVCRASSGTSSHVSSTSDGNRSSQETHRSSP